MKKPDPNTHHPGNLVARHSRRKNVQDGSVSSMISDHVAVILSGFQSGPHGYVRSMFFFLRLQMRGDLYRILFGHDIPRSEEVIALIHDVLERNPSLQVGVAQNDHTYHQKDDTPLVATVSPHSGGSEEEYAFFRNYGINIDDPDFVGCYPMRVINCLSEFQKFGPLSQENVRNLLLGTKQLANIYNRLY